MKNMTEEFVFNICKNTFLSLWSYANPLGKGGKELCDILVVCAPHIIIFSVKEIKVSVSGDLDTDWLRWNRRAVKKSSKQIYGAERWLRTSANVIQNDGSSGLELPNEDDQIFHRVSIALGGDDKVPIIYGDLGKGFIHVFDEISFAIVLQELDTISDFIKYLSVKENLYESGAEIPFLAGEENLLALYLLSGREFPSEVDSIFINGDIWSSFISRPEYKRKKEEDKVSYAWDKLIDDIGQHVAKGNLAFSNSPDNGELILRIMAREDRFSRRVMGKALIEFIQLSSKNIIRSRMVVSPGGILYVFLAIPHNIKREYRLAELGTRCFIAKGLNQQLDTVIGIATEQYEPGTGHSFDLYYLHKEIWTENDQKEMESIQKESGFFINVKRTESSEDEYPQE